MLKDKLQEKLESFGIPSKVYKKNVEVFFIENNNPRTKLFINCPNDLELNVKGSKKERQAVINFIEPAQTIEEEIYSNRFKSLKALKEFMEDDDAVRKEASKKRMQSKGSRFTVKSVSETTTGWGSGYQALIIIDVRHPARENNLLVGFDEKSTFICQLPEKVNSVKEAHEVLRPKDISNKAVRVGEWFFDPIDEDMAKEVLAKGSMDFNDVWYPLKNTYDPVSFSANNEFDPRSDHWDSGNHHASFITAYENDIYVLGRVWDADGRHDVLILPTLHRVVMNRELVNMSDKWD